jgi:cell division protein FtsZ
VNEASGIIQSAAHEDANIIFGAVQDETMGDEVKITVIATGFRQQEMPQRRERMLAEATLPTMRYDVPIQPRVSTSRAAARFASESTFEAAPVFRPEDSSPEPCNELQRSAGRAEASPELIPVPASVFDDDFFQGSGHGEEADPDGASDRTRETGHFSAPARVQQQENVRVVMAEPGEAVVRGTSLDAAGASAESDELDIPAFLRRGN